MPLPKCLVEVGDKLLSICDGTTPPPEDDFAFAHALQDWEEKGEPPDAWFSTEDPWMLHHRDAVTEAFGLPVVTRDEGTQLEIIMNAARLDVCELGFLKRP